MTLRKKLMLLMYVFVAFWFYNFALTGSALIHVKGIGDALDLLKMDQLAIVRFFKVVIDYQHSIPKLILHLLRLIPVGSLLFVMLWLKEGLPYMKKRYCSFFLLVPVLFVLISVVVALSLNGIDINVVLLSVNILGYITFILASAGLLGCVVLILLFMSHLIDVEVAFDYNEVKERAYDRKL